MASIISLAQERPTIDLETVVVIGSCRSRKWVTLDCAPEAGGRFSEHAQRLLVAINPATPPELRRYPGVERYTHGGDTYWLQFPSWMENSGNSATWTSQSISGAMYPSRTDLRQCFGVPGVVLLQVLKARAGQPCFTSYHEHYSTREVFDPLDSSEHTEYRRGVARWQLLKRKLVIPAGTRHQLRRAEPGFSVVLIQMYGATRIEHGPTGPRLDMSDHIYR